MKKILGIVAGVVGIISVSEQRSCEFQRTADHRRHKPNRKRCVSRALPFYVQHDNYSVAAALSVSLAASVASVLPASSVLSVLSVPVSL